MRVPTGSTFALLVMLAAAGCAGGTHRSADKAGGTPPRNVISLAVADPETTPESRLARQFADTVLKLSHGTLHVRVAYLVGGDRADGEPRTIDDVRAGRHDLGWVASRAWDERGVTSLEALQAPFLITNYALLDAVLRTPTATQMLNGLARAGVVPLVLVPGLLRHPVGMRRLLRSVDDFRGARIRDFPSQTTDALLIALGATPVHLSSGEVGHARAAGAIDGAELALFPDPVGTPTANVVFFPKVITLFANRSSLGRLGNQQRSVVRAAAKTVARENASFPVSRSIGFETTLVSQYCRPGAHATVAAPSELAALRRAAGSVYSQLERDPVTSNAIHTIRSLAQHLPSPPPITVPRSCLVTKTPSAPPSADSSLNGTYRHVLTAAGARAFGPPATDPGNSYPLVITTILRDGHWTASSNDPPDTGNYTTNGNTITFGPRMRFTLARNADGELLLTPVPPIDPGDAWIMSGSAWHRLGPPLAHLP